MEAVDTEDTFSDTLISSLSSVGSDTQRSTSSSPAPSATSSMPDLAPAHDIFPIQGDTRPNTPESPYHVSYACSIHGEQNYYGPYCNCPPEVLSVKMPPRLANGSWPPILPDGTIQWPAPTTLDPVAPKIYAAAPPVYTQMDTSSGQVVATTQAQPGVNASAKAGPSNAVVVAPVATQVHH